MCNTSKTASSNSEFLAGEISWNQQNLDYIAISQSIIPWIHWSGDKSHPSLSIHCHGYIICLKFNIPSLSLSYPPSTVVKGLFRQRDYSIYPKVADFTDKNVQNKNIVSALATCVTQNSVFYLTWRWFNTCIYHTFSG